MTKKQKEHIDKVMEDTVNLMYSKYKKGVREHGGNLWDKKELIDMAISEAIDQVVYLLTLKQQIKNNNLGTKYDRDENRGTKRTTKRTK